MKAASESQISSVSVPQSSLSAVDLMALPPTPRHSNVDTEPAGDLERERERESLRRTQTQKSENVRGGVASLGVVVWQSPEVIRFRSVLVLVSYPFVPSRQTPVVAPLSCARVVGYGATVRRLSGGLLGCFHCPSPSTCERCRFQGAVGGRSRHHLERGGGGCEKGGGGASNLRPRLLERESRGLRLRERFLSRLSERLRLLRPPLLDRLRLAGDRDREAFRGDGEGDMIGAPCGVLSPPLATPPTRSAMRACACSPAENDGCAPTPATNKGNPTGLARRRCGRVARG
jgi:hypothetical protein